MAEWARKQEKKEKNCHQSFSRDCRTWAMTRRGRAMEKAIAHTQKEKKNNLWVISLPTRKVVSISEEVLSSALAPLKTLRKECLWTNPTVYVYIDKQVIFVYRQLPQFRRLVRLVWRKKCRNELCLVKVLTAEGKEQYREQNSCFANWKTKNE